VAFTAEVATLAVESTTEVAAATVASTMEDILRLLGCAILEDEFGDEKCEDLATSLQNSNHSHQSNHRN
jgi:hypothetical protein